MEKMEETRAMLLELVNELSPLEQSLLQICSIIDEPIDLSTILKILRKARLQPEARFRSEREIDLSLRALVRLKMLNANYQVPEAIKEIIVRQALEVGLLFRAPELLVGIDSPSRWTDNEAGDSRCISCGKLFREKSFTSPNGPLCGECVLSELKIMAAPEDIFSWTVESVSAALSPAGDLKSRLSVIWKFAEWHRFKGASGDISDNILSLLVRNMGFDQPHPLALAVRRAALRACTLLGQAILPFLLRTNRRETWQLNVNVFMALSNIAPDSPHLRVILQEASTDPFPETRRHAIFILNKLSYPWAIAIIRTMSGDSDPETRTLANNSLDAINKKHGRTHPYQPGRQTENPPSCSSVRFGPLAKAIQEELPLLDGCNPSQNAKMCRRILRNLRIAIHGQDVHLFYESLKKLSNRCGEMPESASPLLQICNNPFSEEWFNALPEEIRVFVLPEIFYNAVINLQSDADALACVMKSPLFKTAPHRSRTPLLYHLTTRLILGGRIKEALALIPEIDSSGYSGGLLGLSRFVEGKNDEAIASFDADIKELRRQIGKKNVNFSGIVGIFYILALIKSRNSAEAEISVQNLKKAEQLLTFSLAGKNDSALEQSAFRSLLAVIHLQNFKMEDARELISREPTPASPLAALFAAIATFWVNGQLPQATSERISAICNQAREMGLDWVAMECAALLIRIDNDTPERREFIEQVASRTGMQPFVPSIAAEEIWKKNLRALMQISSLPQKNAGEARLIWLVAYLGEKVTLRPIEQKLAANGSWSKGRPVALSRLFSRTKLDFASHHDLAICAALRREQYYYREDFFFDNDALLPALVGHPRLFLEKSPAVRAEFVAGEPEIMISRAGSMLHIKPITSFTDANFMLIQETPTRFKFIKFTDEHHRIARIIGTEGLKVPESASGDVLTAIAALSSFVLVHSDIGGKTADVETVHSDPTPRVHLLPSGPGFRMEVFVMPFHEKDSPCLKPGMGAINIISEINGKRLQTQRDLASEERLANALEEVSPTFARLSDPDRKAFIEDPEDCLQILLDLKALQDAESVIVEWPEGEKLKVTTELSSKNLYLKIGGRTNWFELSGSLQVDEELTLDMKRLLELLQTTGKRFIPLDNGRFLVLTSEFRKRLDELDIYTEKKGKELHLHPLAAFAMQDLAEVMPNLAVDAAWQERLHRIQVGQEINPAVPPTLRAELRDYQEEGYRWLARLSAMGIGACLADDMGLGKTIQALTLLLQDAARGPSLVIAPTSVCWNWCAEASRFAPTLNAIQFTSSSREELVRGLGRNDVLIASYGLLIQEEELLASVDWNIIILDEAQAIKNVMTRRFQAALKLKGNFRMITTGTPIQNHLDELWALFSFINPGLLGMQQKFNTRFAIPIEKHGSREARTRLKKLIQPFILRRLKSQVLEELPPRTEVVLQVEMSPEESAFYEALRRQALEKIEADSAPVYLKQLKILAEITRLRQAACNPRLVIPDTALASSKLALFGEVVEELLENRHKALVFSQFVRHLDLLREYLDDKNITYHYLDGSTPPQERKKAVDAFQAGEGDLFLISLKAGGLGLNLTAADYVIHMDPWWNPSVEDQASDRAHRIGQQQPVTVYRLVAKNTIEEKIVRLHQEKRDLAGSLLDGTDISGKISADELVKLIREG